MNCRKVTHLLSAYIDGELQGVEHRQIHEHLAGCSECAQEHRGLVQMKRMLASMRVREPSADLPQRILSHVRMQQTFRAPWLDQFNRWVQVQGLKPQSLALAATFALGGIIFASYTIDRVDTSDHATALQSLTPAQVARLQAAPVMEPAFAPAEFAPGVPFQTGDSPYMQTDYRTYDYYPASRRSSSPPQMFVGQPRFNRIP